jgi:hypothetical protein
VNETPRVPDLGALACHPVHILVQSNESIIFFALAPVKKLTMWNLSKNNSSFSSQSQGPFIKRLNSNSPAMCIITQSLTDVADVCPSIHCYQCHRSLFGKHANLWRAHRANICLGKKVLKTLIRISASACLASCRWNKCFRTIIIETLEKETLWQPKISDNSYIHIHTCLQARTHTKWLLLSS